MFDILSSYNNSITLNETIKIALKTNYNIKDCIKIINNTYYNNNDDFLNISELYSNNFNRDNFKKIIYKDQWLIPLKFHENLIIELNTRNITKLQKNNYYKFFIYNFSNFDILMNKNNEIAIDFFINVIYNLCQYKYKNNK